MPWLVHSSLSVRLTIDGTRSLRRGTIMFQAVAKTQFNKRYT
jgi:hypothetical protein